MAAAAPWTVTIRIAGVPPFSVELDVAATARDAKIAATAGCDIDPEAMRIIYKGKVLKDEDPLSACGLKAGESLHVARVPTALGSELPAAVAAPPAGPPPEALRVTIKGPGGAEEAAAQPPSWPFCPQSQPLRRHPRAVMSNEKAAPQRGSGRRISVAGLRLHKDDYGVDEDPPSLLPELVEETDEEDKMHWSVKWAVGLLIVVNAAFLGACTNAADSDTNMNAVCQGAENVFTVIFLLEFLLKLYLLRLSYFYSGWNWMDFILLLFSALDAWILTPVMGSTQIGKGMVLRLFRLLRVLRIFKLLKQRQELLILIEGLGAAFQSMIWVAILLVIVIYGAALFCVSVFRDVDTNNGLDFSDVPNAMFTMFTVGTLADWTSIVVPVIQEYVWAGPFFIAFVLLTNFAMLNLVIGVITERTTSVNQLYEQERKYHSDVSRLKIVESLAGIIFEECDRSFLTREDLHDIVHNHEVGAKIQELFMEVDLPIGFTVGDLHGMLDKDGRGQVSKRGFIEGMASIMFCSEFQQNCLIQAALAALRMQIKTMLDTAVESLRADLLVPQPASQMQKLLTDPLLAVERGEGGWAQLRGAQELMKAAADPPSLVGNSDRGWAQLKAAEDMLKASVADRTPDAGWAPHLARGAELERLVGEIAAGCASWTDEVSPPYDSLKSARRAPAPHFRPPAGLPGGAGRHGRASPPDGQVAQGRPKPEAGGGPLQLVPEPAGAGGWSSALAGL